MKKPKKVDKERKMGGEKMKKWILARSGSRGEKGERSGKRRGESNAYRKADRSFESAVRAAQGFAIKMLISAVLLLSVVASASAQFNLVATIPGSAPSAIVGDVDNDGNNELLVLNSSQKQVRIYDGSLDLKAVLNFSEAPKSAVIADPDDDNKNELIVGTSDGSAGGYVYVGEVHEDKFMQEWKSPWIGSFHWSTELAVGDSDNDGKKEIAVGVSWYGRYLVVYEWTGSTYTQVFRDNIGSDVNSVAYGDIDGDGVEELLVGTACWSDYALRVYDSFSLTYRLHQGSTIVAAGDVDGDNKKEIVTGAGTYCGYATTPSPVIKVFEGIDGGYNVSWTSETLPHLAELIYVCTGDLISSPSEEIAMSTYYPGKSTAVMGIYTKSTNSSYICIYWEEYPDEDTTHIEIGDYDNDGQNELIVTTNKKVRIYEVTRGLADSPWPMFRHDEKHTGRSPYVIPDKPMLKWAFNISSPIGSSPAIGPDGTIYIGADDGKLYAIYPNGTLKWSFKTGDKITSSPAVARDGTIYVGSYDGYVYAIHPNGTMKWKFKTISHIHPSPVIDASGIVYIAACYDASWHGELYAFYPNGTLKWKFRPPTSGSWIYSSPAIGENGEIIFGDSTNPDGVLWALNPENGSVIWRCTLPSPFGENDISSSPAIDKNGMIYVGGSNTNRYLWAVYPNGTIAWHYDTGGLVPSSPAIGSDGTIYIGSYSDKLFAINPNGTLKWSFLVGGDIYSSPAIDAEGTIIVGCNDGKLYAINPNGTLKWTFSTGGAITSSPAIDYDGTIYVGSKDGNLYAIGGKELEGKLHITITTDKTEYTTGDIMLANITIANPTGEVKHVLFNWWVTVPSKGFYTAPLATVPMTLPPAYNTTFTYTITVGYWGAESFGAVFCVALANQTTNKIISSDLTFWNYNPTTRKKKVSVESIVKEIRRAIR